MIDDEFRDWLRYHKAAFPGLGDWLRKNPDTVAHWERALADVDAEAARDATDAMLAGAVETPRGYTEHVRTIRSMAKEIQFADRDDRRPARIDGYVVYDCALCLDSGFVLVLDAEHGGQDLLDWARGDRRQPRPASRGASVACTCATGESKRHAMANRQEPQRPRQVDRYDRTRHFRLEFQWANTDRVVARDATIDVQGLLDWVESRYEFLVPV
jgi:hypothetical protein